MKGVVTRWFSSFRVSAPFLGRKSEAWCLYSILGSCYSDFSSPALGQVETVNKELESKVSIRVGQNVSLNLSVCLSLSLSLSHTHTHTHIPSLLFWVKFPRAKSTVTQVCSSLSIGGNCAILAFDWHPQNRFDWEWSPWGLGGGLTHQLGEVAWRKVTLPLIYASVCLRACWSHSNDWKLNHRGSVFNSESTTHAYKLCCG